MGTPGVGEHWKKFHPKTWLWSVGRGANKRRVRLWQAFDEAPAETAPTIWGSSGHLTFADLVRHARASRLVLRTWYLLYTNVTIKHRLRSFLSGFTAQVKRGV